MLCPDTNSLVLFTVEQEAKQFKEIETAHHSNQKIYYGLIYSFFFEQKTK